MSVQVVTSKKNKSDKLQEVMQIKGNQIIKSTTMIRRHHVRGLKNR